SSGNQIGRSHSSPKNFTSVRIPFAAGSAVTGLP
ncbi:MAG: hypothetical protein, partial [Olavius algarvensis Gamma 1 endosymbiont]